MASAIMGQTPALKRRESTVTRGGDQLTITPLGTGNEVGRSCIIMSYKGKTVMTNFKGRVFMTHATKAIYRLLLSDYVKVSKVSVEDMLYDEQDIVRSMDKIEVIHFHQTLKVNGMRFWCSTAGHVLGAAMFIMADISGVQVLYPGDYSRESSLDICVIESTYGVQTHQPRHIRAKRFTDVIHSTVSQGGRVLMAEHRSSSLSLTSTGPTTLHLINIPIYYASPLAKGMHGSLSNLH